MHEYAHFQFWKERYDQLRAQGMNHQEACFHLNLQMSDGEFRLLSERNSIRAEMQAESEHKNSPYNRAHYRAHDFWESGYINRLAYPEFEAVRSELEESKNREPNKQKARLYMKQMVEFALKARDEALAYRKKHHMGLKFAMGDTVYDLIAKPYGMERLGWPDEMKENPTLTSKILFLEVLRDVCDELNVPAHQCDQENMPRPQMLKAVGAADFSTPSHPVDDGQQQ
jgi:hypothetical protein